MPNTSPLSSYLRQFWFAPAFHPSTFRLWTSLGLTQLIDITKRSRLLDKLTLEQQVNHVLPWFQYLQLSHLITRLNTTNRLNSDLTAFENLLYKGTTGGKGLISTIYKLVLTATTRKSPSYVATWNKESSFSINNLQWELVWTSPINRSQFLNVKIQFFKLVTRWYLTPHHLHLISHAHSIKCWKNCDERATQFHIW